MRSVASPKQPCGTSTQIRGIAASTPSCPATTPAPRIAPRRHFVRCINPNPDKAPDQFDGSYVANQLRSAGVLHAVRLARSAYPARYELPEVWRIFGVARRPHRRAPPPPDPAELRAAVKGLLAETMAAFAPDADGIPGGFTTSSLNLAEKNYVWRKAEQAHNAAFRE